jgi:cytochrome c biogenesis protein CcmG, thiol:disulfide interchange protein DsbE
MSAFQPYCPFVVFQTCNFPKGPSMSAFIPSRARRALLSLPLLALPMSRSHAISAGAVAPGFDLAGMNGQIKLSELRGKVVYVDFWASWCGPCKLSFPWLNEMQTKYGKSGLQIIAINVDAQRADADKFLARIPAQFMIAFDPSGSTAKAYDVKQMPSSAVVGPDGKVLYTHAGWREEEKSELEGRVAGFLKRR